MITTYQRFSKREECALHILLCHPHPSTRPMITIFPSIRHLLLSSVSNLSFFTDFCEDPTTTHFLNEALKTFKKIDKECYLCDLHLETATVGWVTSTNILCSKPNALSENKTRPDIDGVWSNFRRKDLNTTSEKTTDRAREMCDLTGANPKVFENAPTSKSRMALDRDRITLYPFSQQHWF